MDAIGKYFRYDAARNEKGHADRFWSWALAGFASMDAKKIGFYKQYASQKNKDVIQLNVSSNTNNSTNIGKPDATKTTPTLTKKRRNRSLDGVLRGFNNVWTQ